MTKKLEYKSTGVELFDKWSNTMLMFLASVVALWFLGLSFTQILGYSVLLVISSMAFHIIWRLSKITRIGDTIILADYFKQFEIKNIESMDSWWCYESAGESPEFSFGFGRFFSTTKMKGHTNKINIFVRLKSNNDFVLIREQIHLSSKFPNNHPYRVDEIVDKQKVFKVWDVDQCIKQLKLIELVKINE